MTRRFARTREREKAWKLATYILIASCVAGPACSLIYYKGSFRFIEILWAFSLVLESLCIVPQLLLLRQTSVPTVIDSYYLVTLGSYRALYILNWIWRSIKGDYPNWIAVIFGIVQTAFYIDFAWVYYTRQRVKLRGGAVVDSDDLNKGFLVNRFARRHPAEEEDHLEAGEAGEDGTENPRPRVNNWGQRGVSIRADDTLDAHDRVKVHPGQGENEETAPLADPDHFLSDDEDDDAPAIDTSNISTR